MKNATLIAMTFATLLATGAIANTADAGKYCKSITATASGESAGTVAKFRLRRAKRRAISAWENGVEHHYGGRYADIDNAKYTPKMSCGLNDRGNTRCVVKAIPCRKS